jgi:benzoate/toluate 1,2-dioxygenase alpha subunit
MRDGLVVEAPGDFRVHGSVYTDPAVFAAEMDRIFGTTWVYVAHESELPAPGDYKTATIGLQPVIVSRDDSGAVHVLLNRCRHRGSIVCRAERGNARSFQCPYHGWVYANDGRLTGVAQRGTGYPEDFDQQSLGLQPVARVDTYRGLVFASLARTGPALLEHLGPARQYVDLQFDRSPDGEIDLRYAPQRTEYDGNWKFQVENATDGYHVNFVHESFQLLLEEFAQRSGQHGNHSPGPENRQYWDRIGATRGFDGGHGLLEAPASSELIAQMRSGPERRYLEALERRLGKARALEALGQYHVVIYPNLAIIHGQLRVIQPLAVDRTRVVTYPFALKGISAEEEAGRLRGFERFFGPAGFGQPDDMEIFALNQAGLQAAAVEWLVLVRGLHDERTGPHGERIGGGTAETPIRAAFRAWKALMKRAEEA